MHRIDDFLIDRVFQKIADALHRHASCYAIGAFLLTGFALIHFAWWGLQITKGEISAFFGVFVSLLWIPARVLDAIRVDRQWSGGRDTLPPDRIRDVWFRVCFLCFLPLDWPIAYIDGMEGRPFSMFSDLAWSLCVAGAYFLACTPKRPTKQRQTHLAWGAR